MKGLFGGDSGADVTTTTRTGKPLATEFLSMLAMSKFNDTGGRHGAGSEAYRKRRQDYHRKDCTDNLDQILQDQPCLHFRVRYMCCFGYPSSSHNGDVHFVG